MGNSSSFDTGTGELAPRTGEFLAGVLALSRISRVTVALESGHGAGPALLAAARLTAHAETCLLFDRWHGDPLANLAAALCNADPDLAVAASDNLAQALRTLQARERQSFLVIFDRFDDYLAQPADQPHSAAFDQAFVQMANDSELDLHFLLVQHEAAEPLLERYRDAIPGIGDGCLRMPAGGMTDGPGEASASDAGRLSRRDRSFGMLLERLTAIPPADEAMASPARDSGPSLAPRPADVHQPLRDIAPEPGTPPLFDDMAMDQGRPVFDDQPLNELRPVFDDTLVNEAGPVERESANVDSAPPFALAQAASMESTVPPVSPVPASEGARGNVLPDTSPRRGKALAALMAVVLAVGAGFYAYRHRAPEAAAPEKPASAQAAAPAPAPDVAATPLSASVEPQPANAAPALTTALAATAPAPAMAPAAPAVTPAAPVTPVAPVTSKVARTPAGSATPGATPTVYVHVRSQRERDRMQSLTRTLAGHGIRVIDVKVMKTGPSVADLRYFRDEDRDTALAVQKAMVSAGIPLPRLSRMNGYENSTRPGRFEAWLGGDKAPEPVSRR